MVTVGTSNPDRTISLIGCGASGAYAPGPDEEEEVKLMIRQTVIMIS